MPRGGKRKPGPGKTIGRPKVAKPPSVADRSAAARLLEALNRPERSDDSHEIKAWRVLANANDTRVQLDTRKYLYDKRDGKAVHTVNHLHDRPLELTVTHTLSERMRLAMEKAEKRVHRNR